jgi:hypothetical protein
MANKQVVKRHVNECIFCGFHGKLSGEHQYAAWISEFLPLDLASKNHTHFTGFNLDVRPDGTEEFEESNIRKVSGDPGSQKIHRVCETCNNEWMSRLQDEAMPFIRVAIQKGWPAVEGLEVVARWCLMTTMVFEFDDPRTAGFTRHDRHRFRLYERELYLQRKAGINPTCQLKDAFPAGTVIWIGKMRQEEQNRTKAHRGWPLHGWLAMSLHIGNFVFQLAKVDNPHIPTMQFYANHKGMRLIWPRRNSGLVAEPIPIIAARLSEIHGPLLDFFQAYLDGLRTSETGRRVNPPQDIPWRFDPRIG